MCTFNIELDNQLVYDAEKSLDYSRADFQCWLQLQVESLLINQISRRKTHVQTRKGLTDEQLALRLAEYPSLTDADFPDLSKSDYDNYIRSTSGHVTKGLDKWL